MIEEGSYGCAGVNMATERRDPLSLLNWMERIIRMYKECPELAWGDWKLLDSGTPSVFAMQYTREGQSVLTLHNLSSRRTTVRMEVDHPDGSYLFNMLSDDDSHDRSKRHSLQLEPYGYRWFRVGQAVRLRHTGVVRATDSSGR